MNLLITNVIGIEIIVTISGAIFSEIPRLAISTLNIIQFNKYWATYTKGNFKNFLTVILVLKTTLELNKKEVKIPKI